ncbi:hypothetical protein FKM82_015549 [Ascaphus truei]
MVELIHTLADHSDDVNSCAFSDSYLATCSLDKTIRVYCLKDFKEVPFSPLRGHTYAVHCCCFSHDKPILSSCSTDGKTILWSLQNGQMLASMEQPSGSPVRVCKFLPNSTYLVSGAADGSVVLWNVPLLKFHRAGRVKDGSLVACAVSPGGEVFITGSSSGDLTAWDENMRCLHTEKAHDLGVTCCDISPQPISDDGHGSECFQMASCGQDNQIRLWVMSFSDVRGMCVKFKGKDTAVAGFDDGYSYEKKAIENWISTKRTSPMTNLPLQTLLLTPNRTLKMALNHWLETQNHGKPNQITAQM